jgi:hypothetical protein
MRPRTISVPLVGRTDEIATLRSALAGARAGTPATVLIGGEAGVGKSRLISEFTVTEQDAGARVLTGGCLELGADGLPFAPFTAVLWSGSSAWTGCPGCCPAGRSGNWPGCCLSWASR